MSTFLGVVYKVPGGFLGLLPLQPYLLALSLFLSQTELHAVFSLLYACAFALPSICLLYLLPLHTSFKMQLKCHFIGAHRDGINSTRGG